MTSQRLGIRGLLVVSVLSAASWGWGPGGDEGRPASGVKPLGVTAAAGDTTTGLLTIHGRHLLPGEGAPETGLVVKLGEQALEVVSATQELIQAVLPAGLVPGTYLLMVSAGLDGSWAAPVTVGAPSDAFGPVAVSMLRVQEAHADLVAGTLLLRGESLGTTPDTTPTVTLSDVPLAVLSATEVEALAQLPAGLEAGTYRVRVVRSEPLRSEGTASIWTDAMDVTTVGAGGAGGDITAVNTPAGGGLQGGTASGDANLGLQTCGAGQVLKSDGSSWGCAADNGPADPPGRILLPDGTPEAPSITFASDPGAGIYRLSPSTVGLTTQTLLHGRTAIGGSSGGPAPDHLLYVYQIDNTTTGTDIGTGSYLYSTPAAPSSANKYGLIGEVLAGGVSNQSGTLAGLFAKGQGNPTSPAVMSSVTAIRSEAKSHSGDGTITFLTGLDQHVYTADAVVTTARGYHGNAPRVTGAGSIGTFTHIYLEAATDAGDNYGLVSLTAKNGFGTATPVALVQVSGGALVTALATLKYRAWIALNASLGNWFTVTVTNGEAHAFAAPTNPVIGQRITITVRNTFGVIATATFDAAFKTAGYTAPANGFRTSADFGYDGTNWVQLTPWVTGIPN